MDRARHELLARAALAMDIHGFVRVDHLVQEIENLLHRPGLPDDAGEIVLQLQGQPNVRYILQGSSDLASWTNFLTNTLNGTTLNITNSVPSDSPFQFYRAAWEP